MNNIQKEKTVNDVSFIIYYGPEYKYSGVHLIKNTDDLQLEIIRIEKMFS
jgi:hypothetical protein